MEYINRYDYPILNQIMWDTQAIYISHKDAFYLYETRWKYIDKLSLNNREVELLATLTKEVGKGLFLHA